MKKFLVFICGALLSVSSPAATLNVVQVAEPALECVFNPNCTNSIDSNASAFSLPGTTGTGFLRNQVVKGRSGAPAAGLYGYLYQIDLTGLSPTNGIQTPCFTNSLLCLTNLVAMSTNGVVCRTNIVGGTNLIACVTNVTPATNVVFCYSTTVPGTNIVQCLTNSTGNFICFTNVFPDTNISLCVTARFPERRFISCLTNNVGGSEVVRCRTNNGPVFSFVFDCLTNTVPCPGFAPCVSALSINFGNTVSNVDLNGSGTNGNQAFVLSTGGTGSQGPTSITQNGSVITLRFDPPICAGSASYYVGLLSRDGPETTRVALTTTDSSNVAVRARGPRSAGVSTVSCDFIGLQQAIAALSLTDLVGSDDTTRLQRQFSLLQTVNKAILQMQTGNFDDAEDTITDIHKRVGGDSDNNWVRGAAAQQIDTLANALRNCLNHSDDNEDDD